MEIDLKELELDCARLIIRKIAKEMTSDEYYLALLNLHKKYPILGHDPSFTKEQFLKHDIQPKNFYEAAQIYGLRIKKREGPKQERLPYKDD